MAMVMTLRPMTPAIARSKYLLRQTVWMMRRVLEYSAQYGGSRISASDADQEPN